MNDEVCEVDWAKLGNAKVAAWLQQIRSENKEIRRSAIQALKDTIAPWTLLEGYGSSQDLLAIAESSLPEHVIPYLIELLRDEHVLDKHRLIEILFDLARYRFVDEALVPLQMRVGYMVWASRLRDVIGQDMALYHSLAHSRLSEVQLFALDLIYVLELAQ